MGETLLELYSARAQAIDSYIAVFANNSMLRYKAIIQTGKIKSGQSYYEHVLNGVLLLEKLRSEALGLGLRDEEVRCLFAAYTIHDINKIPPYNTGRSYVSLATEDNAARELQRLNIGEFFPGWERYLPDIVGLMHLHQGHDAVTTFGLDRRTAGRFALGLDRVEELGRLMRAVDAIDLSHTLEMDKHKHTFLRELNAFVERGSWRFVSHQLAEQRGVLSNLFHNAVSQVMRERFGAIDLLYYQDGVCYLVPERLEIHWGEEELQAVAVRVEQRLAAIQGNSLRQFVKGSSTGIQVDKAALDSGVGFAGVLAQIRSVVEGGGGTYSAKSVGTREADVRAKDLERIQDLPLHETATTLLKEATILPVQETDLQRAYLIDAYRNLLRRHLEKPLRGLHTTSWRQVYSLLGLREENWPLYEAIHPVRRAYFLVRDLTIDFETLYTVLQRDIASMAGEKQIGQQRFIYEYLKMHLNMQGAVDNQPRAFRQVLQRYVHDQHRQCCYCGNAYPAEDWMSANVPPSLNVQLFSARLEGGSSAEPKRMVCPVCRMQFILEKVTWRAHRDRRGAEQVTYYLHLFPRGFLSEPLLTAWRNGLEHLYAEEADESFFIDTLAYFKARLEGAEGAGERIQVTMHKVNGIALPKLSEAIGNVLVMALNAPGNTVDAQFLFTLEKTLLLGRFFPSRILVTRSPVPPLVPDDDAALVLDGVPAAMRWLVPEPVLTGEAIERLMDQLTTLHALSRLLYQRKKNDEPIVELVRAASDDPLALYYAADRMIERKVSGSDAEWQATRLGRQVAPYLKVLSSGGRPVLSTRGGRQ